MIGMKLNNMGTDTNCNCKKESQEVKIKVDFDLVWAIMWRWIVLMFCFYTLQFSLALLIGWLISLSK